MDCVDWLRKQLDDFEYHLVDDIRGKAKSDGITKKQLKEARKILGVKCFHQYDELGDTGNWFWYLEE